MSLVGIIYFIICLGIIILVHEMGHLIVAKRNGVYCHEFSIGMGPKVKQVYKDKTGTVYNIRAIPLGGYVHMAGEDTGLEEDEGIDEKLKFDSKSKWSRFKILVAGASMNFILGILVFFVIGFFGGTPNYDTNEITVASGSPIAQAGVVSGNNIVQINGKDTDTYNDIINELNANESDSVNVGFTSDVSTNIKTIEVKLTEDGKLGISPITEKYHLFSSIKYGFTSFVGVIQEVFYSFYLLTTPEYGLRDFSGPVGIAVVSSGVLKSGWIVSLTWIAFLSINIGIINLMPIPALDGGRILFLLVELIRKKPLNRDLETKLNNLVFILLLALLVFVTFNDILNFNELKNLFN